MASRYDPLTNPDWLYKDRIRDLATDSTTILDFGAGRGVNCIDLRAPGREVLGCDVSAEISRNPNLDAYATIQPGDPLPYQDAYFDLVVSRYVLEHVSDPGHATRELMRVLKPGGHFCAITPNKYGYVAIAASIIPNGLHTAVLRFVQPEKKAEDTFPTKYRLNSRRDLERHFGPGVSVFRSSGEGSYTFGKESIRKLFEGLHKALPQTLQTTMVVEYQKPS